MTYTWWVHIWNNRITKVNINNQNILTTKIMMSAKNKNPARSTKISLVSNSRLLITLISWSDIPSSCSISPASSCISSNALFCLSVSLMTSLYIPSVYSAYLFMLSTRPAVVFINIISSDSIGLTPWIFWCWSYFCIPTILSSSFRIPIFNPIEAVSIIF